MAKQTSSAERRAFYERHQQSQTYEEIAKAYGVSKECVRYWCRRQRDGGSCQSQYPGQPPGLLSHFNPKVRYAILRLRLAHPRWGPNRILYKLKQRPSLKGLCLPSEASIGRYLHQWSRFRRQPSTKLLVSAPTKQPRYINGGSLTLRCKSPLRMGPWSICTRCGSQWAKLTLGPASLPLGWSDSGLNG